MRTDAAFVAAVEARLRTLGLRLAGDGPGWSLRILVLGDLVSVWVTDAPKEGA